MNGDYGTYEELATNSLRDAFEHWDTGWNEAFFQYVVKAFDHLRRAACDDWEFCPSCGRETPTDTDNFWYRCQICDQMHVGDWFDDIDICW